jgi:hypothetical protein
MTAATASQTRPGCRSGRRLGDQPGRTQRGEHRHHRVLIGIGRQRLQQVRPELLGQFRCRRRRQAGQRGVEVAQVTRD